ncbi:MAG: amidohydrolase [Vicinamibacterales bacterium]
MLLHNGRILTVDDAFSTVEAVAIRDGKILAVGGSDLARRYSASRTIDLAGRTVVPGFDDTHMHVWGTPRRYVDVAGVRSITELQRLVADKAADLGPGEWVTGYGWAEDEFAEARLPNRLDLDQAAPANPVLLDRAGGHSAVASSKALELAGLTASTADPQGGMLERDPSMGLTGIIRERQDIVATLVPASTPQELRASFLKNLKGLLALGITSIIEAGVTPTEYLEWEELYRRYGEDLPRAAVQIRWSGARALRAFGRKTGDGNERLRVGAIKVLVDGGFTGPAAYTIDAYKGQPDYHGKLNVTEAELNEIVETGHSMGWQLGFHTIGDAAIQLTIDAFERALRYMPREDPRHYVNHFTVPPPEQTLLLMAKDGILISQQPNFTYTLESRYLQSLEGYKLLHNNPLRTPMSKGIFMALGSDVLPVGPMVGIYAAVTRKGKSGRTYAEEERLTIQEAVRGYTRNGAFFTREENIKGVIEPGKLADLAVLNEDLVTIDPSRLLDVKVDMTIVGGKIVYERLR